MNDYWKYVIIKIALLLAFIVIGMLITRWYYETVIGSSLPDWLKYVLLRG